MPTMIDNDSPFSSDIKSRSSSLSVQSATIDRRNAIATAAPHFQTGSAEVKESDATSFFVVSDPSPALLASMSSIVDQCVDSLSKPQVQVKLQAIMDAVNMSPGTCARMQALSDAAEQISPSTLVPSSRAVVTSLIALHCSSLPPFAASSPPLITQARSSPPLLPKDDKQTSSHYHHPPLAPPGTQPPESQPCKSCPRLEEQRNDLASNIRILGDRLANKQAECERLRADVLVWQDRLTEKLRQEGEATHNLRLCDAQGKVASLKKGQRESKRRRSTLAAEIE